MTKQVPPLTSTDVETEIQQLKILDELVENEPAGIETLRQTTGESPDTIRASVRGLEESGLITPTAQGAQLTDTARELLDEQAINLEERVETLENGTVTFEPGVQPRSDEIGEGQSQSSSGDSFFGRIRELF